MVEFRSHSDVTLVQSMASDLQVANAAWVSNGTDNKGKESGPLINSLMKYRHGSPFEHTFFTFYISAPIFVFREWQRHRISSFNEMSGRYTKLKPVFYIPGADRKMINHGTSMKPQFSYDRDGAGKEFCRELAVYSENAWQDYEYALKSGIANEVARMILPLNIFSEMYWSVNARSLMNFLSLRVESGDSAFRSYPQYEIDQAAQKVEEIFEHTMPETHYAFVKNGRIAP